MIWHMAPHCAMPSAMHLPDSTEPRVIGGVAVVEINGPTSKRGGWGTHATIKTRNELRQVERDPRAAGVMLVIDSPGGTVSGSLDLAQDVEQLAKVKPVFAYAQDLMASAQYQVGSQAGRVYANAAAMIGSIGTMMVLYDMSAMLKSYGVKAVPITSGGMKGAGVPGTKITPEIIGYHQGLIDQMTNQFVDAVARGRSRTSAEVRTWADGRVHIAADAARLGMIDGVMSLPQAMQQLRRLF